MNKTFKKNLQIYAFYVCFSPSLLIRCFHLVYHFNQTKAFCEPPCHLSPESTNKRGDVERKNTTTTKTNQIFVEICACSGQFDCLPHYRRHHHHHDDRIDVIQYVYTLNVLVRSIHTCAICHLTISTTKNNTKEQRTTIKITRNTNIT